MHEQDRDLKPLSEIEASQLLERRKQKIEHLIDETINSLPVMIQGMVRVYRGTVSQYVDSLTFDQTEELINKVDAIINEIRG